MSRIGMRPKVHPQERWIQLMFCETVRQLDVLPDDGQAVWAMAKARLEDPHILGLQGDPEGREL